MAPEEARPGRKRSFPWLVLLLLLASIYVFWILPLQFPQKQVKVEFVSSDVEKSVQ